MIIGLLQRKTLSLIKRTNNNAIVLLSNTTGLGRSYSNEIKIAPPSSSLLLTSSTKDRRNNFAKLAEMNNNNNKKQQENKPLPNARVTFEEMFEDLKELHQLNKTISSLIKKDQEIIFTIFGEQKKGVFIVSLVNDECLQLSTPTLTPRNYNCFPPNNKWQCIIDGHDMMGIFTRDLIPYISGLPRWVFR